MNAIYEGRGLEHYFEAMLRVQARLLKWRSFSVQALYDMIMELAAERVRSVDDKIIEDMKATGLIQMAGIKRTQSLDDFALITSPGYSGRAFHANHYQQALLGGTGTGSQFAKGAANLLTDGRYEATRRVARYTLFWDQHDHRCSMLTFNSAPKEYQFVFAQLREAYLSLQQSCLHLEELWTFLVESVYQKVSEGFLIFADQHKLLFRQEVLEHRYVEEMLKDAQRNYSQLESSMAGLPPSAFSLTKSQAILNEIGLGLISL